MKPLYRSGVLALLVACVLAACGDRNPLIGRWVLEPAGEDAPMEDRAAGALFTLGGGEIEFTPETRVVAGEAEKVTYTIEGSRVTVFNDRGRGTVYEVQGDRMVQSLTTPFGGQITLRFRKAKN